MSGVRGRFRFFILLLSYFVLETTDCLAHALPKAGQAVGAEDEHKDQQDNDEFGESDWADQRKYGLRHQATFQKTQVLHQENTTIGAGLAGALAGEPVDRAVVRIKEVGQESTLLLLQNVRECPAYVAE